jgi:uncharacterized protein YneF (UPF0154 family)
MLSHIVVGFLGLVVGAVGGLLIGRKNPKVADAAAKITEKV